MNRKDYERLKTVDHCMKYLGMSLNLTDPHGSLSSDAKETPDTPFWKAIREDYRKLSDAILALRGGEYA